MLAVGCGHRATAAGLARGDRAGQDLVLARSAASERADVLRLRTLLSLGRVELDLLVLVQRPVTG